MRLVIVPVTLLLVTGLAAQITIGQADMPSPGDTVRYSTTSADGLDAVGTEAGYIWDFGMLIPDADGADTCVTVGSTPLLYQFYFNNPFLYPDHDANYAQRGPSFDFQGQLTVEDVYEYFKKDGTGFRNVGFGANVNGVPASTRREPVDYIHRFPLNFGDMDTSYSEWTLSIPSQGSLTQQQTRYNEVDGYGTLYLPTDTFDVLRVKSTLVRFDSVFIELFGQSFTFPEPETIEYKWIAQTMDAPVLLITAVDGVNTTARFHYNPDDITTGVGTGASSDVFSSYPNPARDLVSFDLPAEGGLLTMRDVKGRLVHSERVAAGTPTIRLDLVDLAQGSYTATFVSTERVWNTQVVVQR